MSNNTNNAPSARLRRVAVRLASLLPEVLLLGGGALLYVGINDIYPPVAKVTAGVLLMIAGFRLARAGDES